MEIIVPTKKNGNQKVVKGTNRFHAYITCNQKRIHLGLFRSATNAAKAYNQMALELFGEFARLNVIQQINADNPLPYPKGERV